MNFDNHLDKRELLKGIESGEAINLNPSRVFHLNLGQISYHDGSKRITVTPEQFAKIYNGWFIKIVHMPDRLPKECNRIDPSTQVYEKLKILMNWTDEWHEPVKTEKLSENGKV